MTKWTTPQQNAIDARNSNILVSAAAGSGKTAVLVERVIKLITDVNLDVDVDKLLIVTFTNAAAAEMKSRIAKKLLEIINKDQNLSDISLTPVGTLIAIKNIEQKTGQVIGWDFN